MAALAHVPERWPRVPAARLVAWQLAVPHAERLAAPCRRWDESRPWKPPDGASMADSIAESACSRPHSAKAAKRGLVNRTKSQDWPSMLAVLPALAGRSHAPPLPERVKIQASSVRRCPSRTMLARRDAPQAWTAYHWDWQPSAIQAARADAVPGQQDLCLLSRTSHLLRRRFQWTVAACRGAARAGAEFRWGSSPWAIPGARAASAPALSGPPW